jgi:hypothetical protein
MIAGEKMKKLRIAAICIAVLYVPFARSQQDAKPIYTKIPMLPSPTASATSSAK